jgi:S-(hydroxymethyl)glutathione dehydrogenase / alcohol dehydrogenase
MKTRAAVLSEVGGQLEIKTLDLGAPQSGEVLVKMSAAGICHSDWHLVTGDTQHPLPVVLGHEGAGVVESVGDGVTDVKVGDHVILNWAPYCGKCFFCLKGKTNLCDTYVGPMWAGTMLDGSTRYSLDGEPVYHYCALACFSEYVVVPSMCCVEVADSIPFDVAAVVGCAVTTGVGSVLNTASVEAGSTVVIYGVGGVGLSTVMGAQIAGAEAIIAVDPLESRLAAARELGATHTLIAGDDVVAKIKDICGGYGADYVFEASGLPAVQEEALSALRPGGELILSGLSAMGSATNLPGAILVREEKTVRGSYYGSSNPPEDFVKYCNWYMNGLLPLDRLVSKEYSLDEINIAFAEMLVGSVRRGVIMF